MTELVAAIRDVADHSYKQGAAVERGDQAVADQEHRAMLAAFGRAKDLAERSTQAPGPTG